MKAKRAMKAAGNVVLTISWKDQPEWPSSRPRLLEGYESAADARAQLKKRRPDREYTSIPGGFKYEEPFACQGERGTLVYTFLER